MTGPRQRTHVHTTDANPQSGRIAPVSRATSPKSPAPWLFALSITVSCPFAVDAIAADPAPPSPQAEAAAAPTVDIPSLQVRQPWIGSTAVVSGRAHLDIAARGTAGRTGTGRDPPHPGSGVTPRRGYRREPGALRLMSWYSWGICRHFRHRRSLNLHRRSLNLTSSKVGLRAGRIMLLWAFGEVGITRETGFASAGPSSNLQRRLPPWISTKNWMRAGCPARCRF